MGTGVIMKNRKFYTSFLGVGFLVGLYWASFGKKVKIRKIAMARSYPSIKKVITRPHQSIDNALNKQNLVHMVVLGSGPAGYSAALYGARFGRYVVLYDGPERGGLLTKTSKIENWPGVESILGQNLIGFMRRQIRSLGVNCVPQTMVSADFDTYPFVLQTDTGEIIHALSVIVATGAAPIKLGVPGEEKYWGQGVSSCAICDAYAYQGQEVVVIGGGNSAAEEAMQLAPYAKKITILVRKDKMRADFAMQKRLLGYPNIAIVYNTQVKEIIGNNDFVTSVKLQDTHNPDQMSFMPVAGVFLAIGHKPNTDFLASSSLKLDERGYIALSDGRTQKTSIPGVFAAGDVEDALYRQAIVASGSGVKAAIDADAYLTHRGLNQVVEKELEKNLFVYADSAAVGSVKTYQEFDELVKSTDVLVVNFSRSDCQECIMFEQLFERIAQKYGSMVGSAAKFVNVDVHELSDIAERLTIYRVPTIMIFKKGSALPVYRSVEVKNEEKLEAALDQVIQESL